MIRIMSTDFVLFHVRLRVRLPHLIMQFAIFKYDCGWKESATEIVTSNGILKIMIFEPTHEIMALIALRKLNLQTTHVQQSTGG